MRTTGTILLLFLCLTSYSQVITLELKIKGAYFKVGTNSAVTIPSSSTVTTTSDNGTIVVNNGAEFIAAGDVVNAVSSSFQVDGTLNLKKGFTNNGTA
ncbi:MAG: hypothetical protein ACJAZ2_000534, partial [Glaciecola sp.]